MYNFETERLPLAIYLHASDTLRFSHCALNPTDGKVRFVFDDPAELGSQAELAFDRGAEIAATNLFASQKYLRRKMSEALDYRRTEESYGTNRKHQ